MALHSQQAPKTLLGTAGRQQLSLRMGNHIRSGSHKSGAAKTREAQASKLAPGTLLAYTAGRVASRAQTYAAASCPQELPCSKLRPVVSVGL